MAKRYNIILSLLSLLLLMACSEPLPRSGGKPYDVAVVANDMVTGRIVVRGMAQCVSNYTTEEPMFNVSLNTKCSEDDIIRLARTLIIVDTANVENTVAIRERNVWAHPQLVLYVRTPSAEMLTYDFNELRDLFAREINDFERTLLIRDIAHHRNIHLTDSVEYHSGVEIFVPAAMKIAKSDSNFIWLTSNNADENMSLCVYRTHKRNVDINSMKSVTSLRDSIMKRYIRGAKESMYWQITPGTEKAEIRNDTILINNRWEMNGDAMGGSSVCRIIEDKDSIVFAEAFLYSPATDKRNKMRRAEAILMTAVKKN